MFMFRFRCRGNTARATSRDQPLVVFHFYVSLGKFNRLA